MFVLRPGLPRRLFVGVGGLLFAGWASLALAGGSGDATPVVTDSPAPGISSAGGTESSESSAAVPVEFPVRSPDGGRVPSGPTACNTEALDGKAAAAAESFGSHTVSATGPDGSGLVVTNSGTATADSGANAGVGATDGTGTNLETGPTEAQGNNSTTEINP